MRLRSIVIEKNLFDKQQYVEQLDKYKFIK